MAEGPELYERMLEAQRQIAAETESGDSTSSRRRRILPTPPSVSGVSTPTRRRRILPTTPSASGASTPARRILPTIPREVPAQTFYDCRDYIEKNQIEDNPSMPAESAFRPVPANSETGPRPIRLFPNTANYQHQIGSGKEVQRGRDIAAAKPKIKPREFNGSSPWEEYWLHFRQVAMLNGWTDENSRQYLLVNLSGMALEFVFTLAESTRDSFNRLTEALSQRFGSAKEAMIHQAALENIRRKSGQTIPALGQEIRRKVRLAYPSVDIEAQEAMTINYFRRAITDATQRMFICNSEPRTLDKAMEAALRAEAYESIEEERDRPSRVRHVEANIKSNDVQEQITDLQKQIEKISMDKVKERGQGPHKDKQGKSNPRDDYSVPRGRGRNQTTSYTDKWPPRGNVRNIQKDQENQQQEKRIKELEEELKRERSRRSVICYRCNEPGHTSRYCTNTTYPAQPQIQNNKPQQNFICYQCHQPGHVFRNCPQNQQQASGNLHSRQQVGTIATRQGSVSEGQRGNQQRLDPTAPIFNHQAISRKEVENHSNMYKTTSVDATQTRYKTMAEPSCCQDRSVQSDMAASGQSQYVIGQSPLNYIGKIEKGNKRLMTTVGCVVTKEGFEMNITFLVDTGADVSILSSRTYKKLSQVGLVCTPTNILLKTANGELLATEGEVELTLVIGGKRTTQMLTVAPVEYDCLLGMDFLKERDFVWNSGKGEVTFVELRSVNSVAIVESREGHTNVSINVASPEQVEVKKKDYPVTYIA